MLFVVYVTPFFQDWAIRELLAVADVPDVRLGVISQDPQERLPEGVRARIAGHWRIDDTLDAGQLIWAAGELAARHGPIWRMFSGQEHTQLPVAEARAALGVPGMSVEATRNFRDKARMKDVLRAAGVPCARHALVHSPDEAWQVVERVGFPLVVKPQAGAGSVTTFRADGPEQLRRALAVIPPRPDFSVVLEEFITGEEHTFETFSLNGKHLWHSLTDYYPSPLEVMHTPWIQMRGVLPNDDTGYDDIRPIAVCALDALGMTTGITHMEWFRRGDGSIVVSEVAARPPGGELMTASPAGRG
jgi:biotin carboxylase